MTFAAGGAIYCLPVHPEIHRIKESKVTYWRYAMNLFSDNIQLAFLNYVEYSFSYNSPLWHTRHHTACLPALAAYCHFDPHHGSGWEVPLPLARWGVWNRFILHSPYRPKIPPKKLCEGNPFSWYNINIQQSRQSIKPLLENYIRLNYRISGGNTLLS